jgi:hypothetical protein
MFGDLLVIPLEDTNIMLPLLMMIVNSLGYSCSNTNMRFSRNFENFRIMWKNSLTGKFRLSNPTGEENTKNLTVFFSKLASLIMCLALMLINTMGEQKESIYTSLRLVYLSLLMLVRP